MHGNSFSNEEAARYLETLKSYENKLADPIKTREGINLIEKAGVVLSRIRSVNRTDVLTLTTHFRVVIIDPNLKTSIDNGEYSVCK